MNQAVWELLSEQERLKTFKCLRLSMPLEKKHNPQTSIFSSAY